ncbi:MAG: iron dependent repressor, metal binding and dimerization domain protein [Eubacteriales bacterium]|nr:iron dependent repressor, metal binding and dimerization domain protein [Eubacteriales bacterium]
MGKFRNTKLNVLSYVFFSENLLGGFLTVDDDGFLHLTTIDQEVAEKIYERHLFFTEQLVSMGVDRNTAEQDACRIEHVISDESFQKLKDAWANEGEGGSAYL